MVSDIYKSAKLFEEKSLLSLGQQSMQNAGADEVGRTLASIVRVILSRAPHDNATSKIKEKFLALNPAEIAAKNSPESASYGQAITLVKTMLNGRDIGFISSALKSLVSNL